VVLENLSLGYSSTPYRSVRVINQQTFAIEQSYTGIQVISGMYTRPPVRTSKRLSRVKPDYFNAVSRRIVTNLKLLYGNGTGGLAHVYVLE
jgi:hypothetical protein